MRRIPIYNADLHLHSPYSIAVSQKLNVQTLTHTAHLKGLNILATGDITQVSWRKSLQDHLKFKDDAYRYHDIAFILGTELEDADSIHHVIFLPDFHAAEELESSLTPYVKNITGRWAGRPHVHRSPAEIVELVNNVGGICGPAHAFTPFKSLFRQGKYDSMKAAYEDMVSHVAFLELGLSADTFLADRIEELQNYTFLSNSDAHSQEPWSLGREFNQIEMESPNFESLKAALGRKKQAKIIFNAGLDPRLGKYYNMFCRRCRRRIHLNLDKTESSQSSFSSFDQLFHQPKPKISEYFITYDFSHQKHLNDFLNQVSQSKIICSACKKELNQTEKKPTANPRKKAKQTYPKLKLGVYERIEELATWETPNHPDHRPPYVHIVPLIDLLCNILQIQTKTSKKIQRAYETLIKNHENEYNILIKTPITELNTYFDGKLAKYIELLRSDRLDIIAGGGGTFGKIK